MILINSILWPLIRNTGLNYRAPMQSRRWIKLLKPHPDYGFLIKPNLMIKKRSLGFSFSSNKLGLRGPDNTNADNVFVGTSFTMGFAVDNGENWYDNIPDWKNYLNLGLPVGIDQLVALYNNFHCGITKKLFLMYHPNFWSVSYRSHLLRKRHESIFNQWKTGLIECILLQRLQARKLKQQFEKGELIKIEHGGRMYFLDPAWECFDFQKNRRFQYTFLNKLFALANEFEQIHLIPVFPKEAYVPESYRKSIFEATIKNYKYGLELVINRLKCLRNFFIYDLGEFSLENFHYWDTHWNNSGNKLFYNKLAKLFSEFKHI